MNEICLKTSDFSHPLPRIVNGFRLCPIESIPNSSGDSVFIWSITPNRSYRTFFFGSIDSAVDFAKKYKNNHSDKFWFNLFSRQYHFAYVCRNLDILCN